MEAGYIVEDAPGPPFLIQTLTGPFHINVQPGYEPDVGAARVFARDVTRGGLGTGAMLFSAGAVTRRFSRRTVVRKEQISFSNRSVEDGLYYDDASGGRVASLISTRDSPRSKSASASSRVSTKIRFKAALEVFPQVIQSTWGGSPCLSTHPFR